MYRSILAAGLGLLMSLPAAAQSTPAAANLSTPTVTPQRPERLEQHIADLRRRLQITPAQQPQWDAFATVMRQNSDRVATLYRERSARSASMSALDDMRSYADLARLHAEDLQRLVPPFEALYAAMTAEQKANADRVFQQFQSRSGRGRRPV